MILYLDTSALVKLYAEEEGTGTVERAVGEAESVATSVVAYAEARAAFARKVREGVFSRENRDDAVEALDGDWVILERSEVTENLVIDAGDLAEEHALRGFDAVHLASALLVREAYAEQNDEAAEVVFLCFDSSLTRAAAKTMRVYEPAEGPDGPSPA